MKERDFLNWIIAVAETTGWKVYHVPAPMVADRAGKGRFVGSLRAAGLPDLFLLHDDPPRMIVAEVKGDGGKLSPKQIEFLALARAVAEATVPEAAIFVGGRDTGRTARIRLVGVYAWLPADQPIIETMLKSKVLL